MTRSALFHLLICLGLVVGPAAHAQTQPLIPTLQPQTVALHLPESRALPLSLSYIGRQPSCSLITWWTEWARAQEGIRNRKDPDVLLLQVWLGIPPALR